MSTTTTWQERLRNHVTTGRLHAYEDSSGPGTTRNRALFLTPAVHHWLVRLPKGAKERSARLSMAALFNRYVRGDDLGETLKQLDPVRPEFWTWDNPQPGSIWEFKSQWKHDTRIRNPLPYRVFGGFCDPDVFIAIYHRPRTELENTQGPKWAKAIHRTGNEWQELLPDHPRWMSGQAPTGRAP